MQDFQSFFISIVTKISSMIVSMRRIYKKLIFLFKKYKQPIKAKIKLAIGKFFLPILLSWIIIHIFFGIFVSLSLFGEILSVWHTLFLTIALISTQYSVRSIELLFDKFFPKNPKKARIIKTVRCIDDGKIKSRKAKAKGKNKKSR